MKIDNYLRERAKRKGGKYVEDRQLHDHGQKFWKKTRCPYCDKSVTYLPQPDFKGILSCPHAIRSLRFRVWTVFSAKRYYKEIEKNVKRSHCARNYG